MNKEQQELVDSAYDKFLTYLDDNEISFYSTIDSFVRECKKDSEYTTLWGLKIEERELSLEERTKLAKGKVVFLLASKEDSYNHARIPTKLITVTYNDKTIESYE
jgi:hypothetical protein